MKEIRKMLGLGVIAVWSFGIGTLSGCRSSDSLAETTPGTGRVAKVAFELKWPPGSANRPDCCSGPAAPQAPPRYAPAAWTQRPAPAANINPPPAEPVPEQTVAAATPPSTPPAPDSDAAPKAAPPEQSQDTAWQRYLPEALPNGKVVSVSEPAQPAASNSVKTAPEAANAARPAKQDTETVATSEADRGMLSQTSLKQSPASATKTTLTVEGSSAAKRTATGELPSLSDFVEANAAAAAARQDHANVPEPVFHVVNNKRIKLHFEIKDTGPAGISGVELWYIHENREWKKPDAAPQKQGPYVVEVDGEGLYGFKLIARNSQGGGEPVPRAGDPPQIWVLVDLTKPGVKIHAAKVLQDGECSRLELSWAARDKNLGHRPVTILYAERPEGPWLPMVANLERSGTCKKRLPPNMPKRFLVRVEAVDIAGNVGADQTRQFLELEAAPSRVSILKID